MGNVFRIWWQSESPNAGLNNWWKKGASCFRMKGNLSSFKTRVQWMAWLGASQRRWPRTFVIWLCFNPSANKICCWMFDASMLLLMKWCTILNVKISCKDNCWTLGPECLPKSEVNDRSDNLTLKRSLYCTVSGWGRKPINKDCEFDRNAMIVPNKKLFGRVPIGCSLHDRRKTISREQTMGGL